MKVVKIILLILLSVIVVGLIAGLFIKKDFHYEKSIEINAPKDVVWSYMVNFKNHEKWSQWKEIDSNMVTNYVGEMGEVGSKMEWTSEHWQVGEGSQTISNILPMERIDIQLDFKDRGKPTAFYTISGDSLKSKVTWGMDFHSGYPMNVMSLLMEGSMNGMLDKGLGMLKSASEERK